jgi:hypothetical protein
MDSKAKQYTQSTQSTQPTKKRKLGDTDIIKIVIRDYKKIKINNN